jgi:hypothetical protein
MSSTENLDAARRTLLLDATRRLVRSFRYAPLACALRAAAALHWRDLKDAKALLDELNALTI